MLRYDADEHNPSESAWIIQARDDYSLLRPCAPGHQPHAPIQKLITMYKATSQERSPPQFVLNSIANYFVEASWGWTATF